MRDLIELMKSDGCSPGVKQDLGIHEILLGENTLPELPALLGRLVAAGVWKKGPIAVLCDANTRRAAGEPVAAALSRGGYEYAFCELSAEHEGDLVPDERAIGAALVAVHAEVTLLISVGSGTITDLTRYVAFRLHLPFVAIPTAASVDGFTSSVAPLILGGIKTTVETAAPAAVLADSTILAAAPSRLLGAGIGDLAGKLTARADWFVAELINGEGRCSYIIELVASYVRKILQLDQTKAATIAGAEALFEGLVVSGLGITLVHSSRPASGAEHHISHFLEMQHERGNAPRLYHGESVAVGTYLVSTLYHKFVSRPFAEIRAAVEAAIAEGADKASARIAQREVLLRRLFGESGDPLVERLHQSQPTAERRRLVLQKLEAGWDALRGEVVAHLPAGKAVAESFARTGVAYDPVAIGISKEILHAAVLCAKEVRPRYSLLALLDDLGMLDAEAAAVVQAVGY
ncbi:MAG TPA: sn-glycerol-1-phosphate dehydrogenase [Spirochaetia bacterium]|nr:sn-glycerol-1-phosphate dehydrogenase [Spirochaetia bacterium]